MKTSWLGLTLSILLQAFPAMPVAFSADAASFKDVVESVRSSGYFAPNAILIFRDSPRTAYLVEPGQVINGIKIKTVNDEAVLAEYNGQLFSVAPTSRPFPIAKVELENYLVALCFKIDKDRPVITETLSVTIGANGGPVNDPSALSYFIRSQPYGALPAGVQSVTFHTTYGYPNKTTQARITQLQLSQPAF